MDVKTRGDEGSITGHHDARTRLENHTGTFPLEILPIHRLLR